MGLFTSNCPGCGKDIEWFLRVPQKHVCKQCGRAVTPDEIVASWQENYQRHLEGLDWWRKNRDKEAGDK